MNLLLALLMAGLLPTDAPTDSSAKITLKGKVESYSVNGFHVNTGDAPHILRDIAEIRLLEPARFKDKVFVLTLDTRDRPKWNHPQAKFSFSISSKNLEEYLQVRNRGMSDIYMKEVTFDPPVK